MVVSNRTTCPKCNGALTLPAPDVDGMHCERCNLDFSGQDLAVPPKPKTLAQIMLEDSDRRHAEARAAERAAQEKEEKEARAKVERELRPRFKVEQPNWREVIFDCPWNGHELTDLLISLPKGVPMVGRLCIKCQAMIYSPLQVSNLVAPDGKPIVNTPVKDS